MTRPLMVCIERTCPVCGVRNRIVTPEVRPAWKIGCSRCGTVLVDPRRPQPLPVGLAAQSRVRGCRPV